MRNTLETKRIVIIGGVAGGASAATRARRLSEQAEIILVERGEYVSFANCGLPYHIGGAIRQRQRLLVQTAQGLRDRYRIDVRTRTEAVSIDRAARRVRLRDLATGTESDQPYDYLILSPGAEAVRPPIPGGDDPRVLTLRSLADMDAIIAAIEKYKPARAAVVGGGYIGLEMTEALRERNIDVTLIHRSGRIFAPLDAEMSVPIQQHLRQHGVELRLERTVAKIEPGDDGLALHLSGGEQIPCGLVIMSVGVRPESHLAKAAGLEIGPSGGIVVDEHMRTGDPAIYAVGDAVEVVQFVSGQKTVIPLAGPANRQGRIAADNICGRDSVYHGTQGTAVIKVFDLTVAVTGLNERMLDKLALAHEKVHVHPASHVGYYPGAAPISLKLLFEPAGGKILGAQAVGVEGVDKRIDVLAVAMRAGMTVFDLEHLELCYAPPYGSAKDVVNYAGFAAANAIRGDVRLAHAADALAPRENQFFLDVRTPEEFEAGTIPGAVNIPIDQLRQRLGELPKDKELLVFCRVGQRGYIASRILSQDGFSCRNLSGGYQTYLSVAAATGAPTEPSMSENPSKQSTVAAPSVGATVATKDVKRIDACGLSCPGPIVQLKKAIASVAAGSAVEITVTDPAFSSDVAAWCRSTGNELAGMTSAGKGQITATVVKRSTGERPAAQSGGAGGKKNTIVVFSGDFDKALAAFVIANGAAAMGGEVTMFFTFWGLNVLRKDRAAPVHKSIVERLFGRMMPRGADRLKLSKLNMGGLGLRMMKGIMRKKNVATLPDLIASAAAAGVKLVACSMSMDLMGIKREELIDGIETGGVATYLAAAEAGNVNLFV